MGAAIRTRKEQEMAKKARFPLEMENGVEVRSLEELRNNFSLSRILGYINDGRLVTWLQDRYEKTIADAIIGVDLSADDAAKKICEIFDVAYDENAEDEIEKAEERERKLEILKKYPDCWEYAKLIDNVAFDQDDLYDLLDENVEEIYLCGNRFSIPVSKTNTKYVGIVDDVVVVINSKQVVDFESKSIAFENCVFDEKYAQLLKTGGVDSAPEATVDGVDVEGDNPVNNLGIDRDEIHDFVEDIMETFEDFANTKFKNECDKLYEYDSSIRDARPFFSGSFKSVRISRSTESFSTKATAKATCKIKLTKAMANVEDRYIHAKKELINATLTYYRDMICDVTVFLENDFYESYEALLDVYCSGDAKAYLKDKLCELQKKVGSLTDSWEEKRNNILGRLVVDHFDVAEKGVASFKELFEMCEYDETYDGKYSFSIDNAINTLMDTYEQIIQEQEDLFPELVYEAYDKIRHEYVTLISEWISELDRNY